MAYKQQWFIPHTSGGWEPKFKALGVWWESLFGSQTAIFLLHPHKVKSVLWGLFYKGSNHLPTSPSPKNITWGIKFQHTNLGETDTRSIGKRNWKLSFSRSRKMPENQGRKLTEMAWPRSPHRSSWLRMLPPGCCHLTLVTSSWGLLCLGGHTPGLHACCRCSESSLTAPLSG